MTTINDEVVGRFLRWRNIKPGNECQKCGGSGVIVYGSTATWRGGIGGCAMTNDVCCECWGSGDKNHHWTNLRRVRSMELALRKWGAFGP